MKQNQLIVLPIIIILFGFVFWTIFLSKGEKKYDIMVNDFIWREINGNIVFAKEANRGAYRIKVKDMVSDSTLNYLLPKSWFFTENKIQIGDSSSKEANSKIMIFYKKKLGKFEKCCEYEIGM